MRGDRTYVVYILASGRYGTLYICVTNDIYRRMQLKHWPREWKTNLIERENPH